MGTNDDASRANGFAPDGAGRSPTATTATAGRRGTADGTAGKRDRINHMPGAGTARAEAVSAGRREMLSDAGRKEIKSLAERGVKRPRIGADAVCEALLRQSVSVWFGYPGGVVLPLYDVLGDYPELRHILVRHEQGAAHAADGYARYSIPYEASYSGYSVPRLDTYIFLVRLPIVQRRKRGT